MLNKRALWILVILVTIAINASSQTQEQTGTIRVTVYEEGTQTPIRGILVSLTPCPNCQRDTPPTTEDDLLGYLIELAQVNGIETDHNTTYRSDGTPRITPVQSVRTDASGSVLFQNVKFGKYEIVARTSYPGVRSIVTVDPDQRAPTVLLHLSGPTAGK